MSIGLIVFLIFAGQILGSLIGLIKRPKECFIRASLGFAGAMMLGISFIRINREEDEVLYYCDGNNFI